MNQSPAAKGSPPPSLHVTARQIRLFLAVYHVSPLGGTEDLCLHRFGTVHGRSYTMSAPGVTEVHMNLQYPNGLGLRLCSDDKPDKYYHVTCTTSTVGFEPIFFVDTLKEAKAKGHRVGLSLEFPRNGRGINRNLLTAVLSITRKDAGGGFLPKILLTLHCRAI